MNHADPEGLEHRNISQRYGDGLPSDEGKLEADMMHNVHQSALEGELLTQPYMNKTRHVMFDFRKLLRCTTISLK